MAERATVARITGVRFSPSALLRSKRRLAKFDRILASAPEQKRGNMKIELRKWTIFDFFRYLRLTLNKDYSDEFSETFFGYIIGKLMKLFKSKREYKFAILVNGKFAGSVALFESFDYKKGNYELGYFVLKKFRNKGIATKASRKVLDFGFDKLKLKKIIAITDIDAKFSKKILRKIGFKIKKRDKKNKEFLWEKRK